MRKALGIVVLLCCCTLIRAQQQMLFHNVWGTTGNLEYNEIRFAEQCSNGDYFLVGTTTVGPANFDCAYYACRMDSVGNMLWEHTWSGVDNKTVVQTVIRSFDNSFIVVGSGGQGSFVSNVMVSEIDEDGNVAFCNYFSPGYHDYGIGITKTSDSCYVVCGSRGIGASDRCPFYIKIDRDGNEVWRQSYPSYLNYEATHIVETPDSGFIVLGWRATDNTFYAKYDKTGAMEWIKYPFGTSDTFADNVGALRANSDGTFDIVYKTRQLYTSSGTAIRAWLQHYTAQGDTIWTKQYLGSSWGSVWVRPEDSTFCMINAMGGYDQFDDMNELENIVVSGPTAIRYIATRDGGYFSYGLFYDPELNCRRFQATKFGNDGRYEPEPFLSTITITPNPSTDGNIIASFDVQAEENVQVRVVGLNGQLVYYNEIFCPANSHTDLPIRLDVETISAGIYILEVKTNTEYLRERIVVSRGSY